MCIRDSSKAIKLDANGEVTDFVMNDKWAAGTGRFLEASADVYKRQTFFQVLYQL